MALTVWASMGWLLILASVGFCGLLWASGASVGFCGFLWGSMGFHGLLWASMGFYALLWASVDGGTE